MIKNSKAVRDYTWMCCNVDVPVGLCVCVSHASGKYRLKNGNPLAHLLVCFIMYINTGWNGTITGQKRNFIVD